MRKFIWVSLLVISAFYALTPLYTTMNGMRIGSGFSLEPFKIYFPSVAIGLIVADYVRPLTILRKWPGRVFLGFTMYLLLLYIIQMVLLTMPKSETAFGMEFNQGAGIAGGVLSLLQSLLYPCLEILILIAGFLPRHTTSKQAKKTAEVFE